MWKRQISLALVIVSFAAAVPLVFSLGGDDKNPGNPDPTRWVYWGDQTWQEMMIGWTDIAYEIKKK